MCVRRLVLIGCLAISGSVPAFAQPAADSYYDFLIGRRLESHGDATGALAAFERAAAVAPRSAEIRAEIAAYHMRQEQPQEAEKAARDALALDDDCIEAHRVLGLLIGGATDRMTEAVTHLERVFATPSGATDVAVQFNLGRLYLFTGAVPKAIDLLQRIVEEQPYLVQARLTLVQAFSAAGRTLDAIETLEPAAGTDPRLNTTLAQLYERVGRAGDAAVAYGRIAALNPSSREAQIRYASSLLAAAGRENGQKALGVVGTLVERDAKDTGALYLQAQAYRRIGDVVGAERSARAILAIDPASLSGAYALAQAHGQARRFRDVVGELEPFIASAAARGQNTTALLTYLSVAYQALGHYDKAIDALKRSKAAEPDESASIDAYLVQAYLSARRYGEAATVAGEARTRFPDDLRFTYLQARALSHSGERPRALSMLEDAVKARPDQVESYLTLADLYGQAGRVDEGVRLLDQAAQHFPDDISVPFRRGAMLAEAKRDAAAEQAFKVVIEREPDNADALNYLGYMLADRSQRLDEAIRLIAHAVDLDADNPSYADSFGWAYFKRGDFAQAEKHLTRAAGALPLNSVVQDHFGDLLAHLGRYRDAVGAWTKALDGDAEDIDRPAIERKIRDARAKAR